MQGVILQAVRKQYEDEKKLWRIRKDSKTYIMDFLRHMFFTTFRGMGPQVINQPIEAGL